MPVFVVVSECLYVCVLMHLCFLRDIWAHLMPVPDINLTHKPEMVSLFFMPFIYGFMILDPISHLCSFACSLGLEFAPTLPTLVSLLSCPMTNIWSDSNPSHNMEDAVLSYHVFVHQQHKYLILKRLL